MSDDSNKDVYTRGTFFVSFTPIGFANFTYHEAQKRNDEGCLYMSKTYGNFTHSEEEQNEFNKACQDSIDQSTKYFKDHEKIKNSGTMQGKYVEGYKETNMYTWIVYIYANDSDESREKMLEIFKRSAEDVCYELNLVESNRFSRFYDDRIETNEMFKTYNSINIEPIEIKCNVGWCEFKNSTSKT
jgi:hypothetical protein